VEKKGRRRKLPSLKLEPTGPPQDEWPPSASWITVSLIRKIKTKV